VSTPGWLFVDPPPPPDTFPACFALHGTVYALLETRWNERKVERAVRIMPHHFSRAHALEEVHGPRGDASEKLHDDPGGWGVTLSHITG
jgi:hypothetical protein